MNTERDMPECEPVKVSHDVHEPDTYELARLTSDKEARHVVRDMMGSAFAHYFREEEEAWTHDDWERDFVQREINHKHSQTI